MQQLRLEWLLLIFDMQIDKIIHPEKIMGMKFQEQVIFVVLVEAE